MVGFVWGAWPLHWIHTATHAYHSCINNRFRGTIAVYSCKASCSLSSTVGALAGGVATGSSAYTEEHVWVQPPS